MSAVTTLLQENEKLKAENYRVISEKSLALSENDHLKTQVEKSAIRIEELAAQVKWFQKQLFGEKSEKRIVESSPDQLFLGQQFQEETAPAQTETVKEHERKKRRSKSVDGDDQNLFFDESVVPVEEVPVPNPEIEGLSEDEYEVIGQKTTHRLAQRPGVYVILKYVRNVVKLKRDEKKENRIVCPKLPDAVFEKSHADVSFLAGLLIDKFQYHLPLYRQHQRLQGAGIDVSRAWLTQLVHRCGDLLEPIYYALVDSIRRSRVKIIDETPIKAGRKKKGKMRTAYFWPTMGGDNEIAFLFFESREHRHVFEAAGSQSRTRTP